MQVYRMKGVKAVKSKGRTYYYWRETMERLPDNEHERARRVAELNMPREGTMANLVADYRQTPAYANLSPATKKDYGRWLSWLETERGTMMIRGATPESVRLLASPYEHTPRAYDKLIGVLSILFNRALAYPSRYGLTSNPATPIGKLYQTEGYLPWTEALYERAHVAAAPEVQDALTLGRLTGQGINEVVSMSTFHWTGDALDFRRQKTGKRIFIPADDHLRAFMEGREGVLLRTATGRPWRNNWLQRNVRDLMDSLQAPRYSFHGIRKLTVIDFKERGLTNEQIANLIGMSEKMVDLYAKGYDQERLARATVHFLDHTQEDRFGKLSERRKTRRSGKCQND